MKHSELMASIKNYYGQYENKFIEEIILEYVLTIPEDKLENAFKKIINNIPRKENQNVVDIARLKKLFDKSENNLEVEANDWYNRLSNTGNSLDNVVISEIRAQNAIESFGGWVDFCQRNPDYEGLHRKNFIEAYMKGGAGESRILYGASSRKYNREALPFGDTEKCKLIISAQKPPEAIEDMTRFAKEKTA